MVQETSMKKLHPERKQPYNTLKRTNHIEQELSEKVATEKKREQQQNQHRY